MLFEQEDINNNTGMKMKQADDIKIDDEIDLNVCQKKTKANDYYDESTENSVETKVVSTNLPNILNLLCWNCRVWENPIQFGGFGVGVLFLPLI